MTNEVVSATVIRQSRQWSLIWLVPMLALILASYVGYQAWQRQGKDMVIIFSSATGLEPGKTRVRYKDVEVGKVTQVSISGDLGQVEVTVALDRQVAKLLHADARFWVVRPRVTTRTISGLSTLLSGAYIALTPGDQGELPERLMGLDEPPTLSGASDGRQFWLTADRLGSMDVGSPVFYRGIAVGEVVSYTLGQDDRMRIQIFVRSPYERLVKSQTKFWNVNGIEVSVGSDGVKAQMESLLSFMQGGLAFENVQQLDEAQPVAEGHAFVLYPNKESITQHNPNLKLTYVMNFSGSVAGLSVGSSVQYQGLEVGQVLDIHPRFDERQLTVSVPVLVEIWPERLSMPDDKQQAKQLLDKMLLKGLRAQLKPANLLTGQMLVDLDYQEGVSAYVARVDQGHEVFPTVPTDIDQIMRSVGHVIAQLEKAPIKETVTELHQTAQGLHRLLDEKSANSVLRQTERLLKQTNATLAKMQGLPATLDATLKQTQETLQHLNKTLNTVSEDSLLQHDMHGLMQDVARAASAVETLADTLQRQPNAVIFGK